MLNQTELYAGIMLIVSKSTTRSLAVFVTAMCLAFGLYAERANAATVNVSNPSCTLDCVATGITGLLVGGATYDVVFEYDDIELSLIDTFQPPIVTQQFAENATDAILAAFQPLSNTNFVGAVIDAGATTGPASRSFFFLLGISNPNNPIYQATCGGCSVTGVLWEQMSATLGTTSSRNWAILSLVDPAPVPLPAALPLLLSALGFFGFFGWRRKRQAAA